MRKLLEASSYTVLLAVLSTLVASVALFVWASGKTVLVVYHMFSHMPTAEPAETTVHLVAILDTFLLAVILYIFSVALYELFIGELSMPEWLIIKDLDDLKKKLSSVIALLLAVTFLEHVTEWREPRATLMFAGAIALVMFALVFYMRTKEKGD